MREAARGPVVWCLPSHPPLESPVPEPCPARACRAWCTCRAPSCARSIAWCGGPTPRPQPPQHPQAPESASAVHATSRTYTATHLTGVGCLHRGMGRSGAQAWAFDCVQVQQQQKKKYDTLRGRFADRLARRRHSAPVTARPSGRQMSWALETMRRHKAPMPSNYKAVPFHCFIIISGQSISNPSLCLLGFD